MTRDDILAMEPGRELDALIAEKVFGLNVVCRDYPFVEDYECGFLNPTCYPESPSLRENTVRRPVYADEDSTWPPEPIERPIDTSYFKTGPVFATVEAVPEYSSNIAGGWLVVDHLRARSCGDGKHYWAFGIHTARGGWEATFLHPYAGSPVDPGDMPYHPANAAQVPEAICKAALLAVMDLA